MTTKTLRYAGEHLAEIVDRVELHRERISVSRNGRPAAVIMNLDDLAGLEETIAVLSDSDAPADIREANAADEHGDVIRGVRAARALRP